MLERRGELRSVKAINTPSHWKWCKVPTIINTRKGVFCRNHVQPRGYSTISETTETWHFLRFHFNGLSWTSYTTSFSKSEVSDNYSTRKFLWHESHWNKCFTYEASPRILKHSVNSATDMTLEIISIHILKRNYILICSFQLKSERF